MKITTSLQVAFGLLASMASARAAVAPLALTFKQVRALPAGQTIIYAPIRLAQGQSVDMHAVTRTDLALRPNGGARGVQVGYFAVKPDRSSVEAIAYEVIPTSAVGGEESSAGMVDMNDIRFTNIPAPYIAGDGSVRIFTVVIGYDVAEAGMPARSCSLPTELDLTVQLDAGGATLLLPAIQAVR